MFGGEPLMMEEEAEPGSFQGSEVISAATQTLVNLKRQLVPS